MEYAYPAKFYANEDGSYTVSYPDLPGCNTEGESVSNALIMAQAALRQWIEYLSDKGMEIPAPSSVSEIVAEPDEFVNLVAIEAKDNRAVKRTVSIPKWLDELAVSKKVSLSRVLQEALAERLN